MAIEVDLNDIYKEVRKYISDPDREDLLLQVNKDPDRSKISIFIFGKDNQLDYRFNDDVWYINLNYNYGYMKSLGKIKSSTEVDLEDFFKKLPKTLRDHIEEINKIFKSSLAPNSIKFITSKVIEKLAKIRKIDTKDIFIGRSAIYDTMTDIEEGRTSRSSGPLKVYHLSEGEHKGRYLLADGYHRLFVFLLNHKTKVDVDVIGYGGGANTDIAIPYKTFSIDPSLKFMGLEDLADEDILEDLKEKLKK